MSNQIVKRLAMLTLVVGLALAGATVSANGQSASMFVTADIPFDFIVANKTLASGKYTVRETSANANALTIRSDDGKSAVIRLSNSAVEKSKERNARLVFHRYGQQYFLAEVWSGDNYGQKLLRCDKERHARQEFLASKGGYEIVEVVAQLR